jgi:lysophospholipase L1-like esterase
MVFLGGSTTELAFAEEKNRFPYLSGRLLEEKLHVKVNSYNGGKSGNGSLHSLDILLNKVIPLKPDLVFLMHNVNDLTVLLYDQTNSYWTTNPYRSPLITEPPNLRTASRKIEEAFHIVRDLTIPNLSKELRNLAARLRTSQVDEFAQVRGKKIQVNKPWLINEFKMNQQTFINICRARNITPVLMTMASRITDQPDRRIKNSIEEPTGLAYHEYKEMFDLFNQAIREVGGANHVMVIDLAQAIPQTKQYLFDVVHFNDEGSKLAASIISERLAPLAASLKSTPVSTGF